MKNAVFKILILVSFITSALSAQEKPEWAINRKIENQPLFYYGVGVSSVSPGDADARALLEFGQNVEVKVKSIFQREVIDEGKEFSDKTKISTELVSDVSLKGIAIMERFVDTTSKSFYSLVQYRKTEYDSMVTREIEREILLIKARNKMIEEKRQEELRAEKMKNLQEEERKKEELRAEQEQLTIERQRQQQEAQKKELHQKLYGEFLKEAPPEKAVSLRNGEVSNASTSVLVRLGLAPFQFSGGFFAKRIWMFEISGNAIYKGKKFDQQEGFIKIQILSRVGEFTKTSLAIGAVQAVGMIADSGYDFNKSKYSFFIAGNYTDPELEYSTFSFYGDKRKISIGATSFPLYSQFKNHLGFVLEANIIFDRDFRNKYGDSFIVNGGVRLQAHEKFSTQLVYESNEQLNLTFEFQF